MVVLSWISLTPLDPCYCFDAAVEVKKKEEGHCGAALPRRRWIVSGACNYM
jgi:hypothetical protein